MVLLTTVLVSAVYDWTPVQSVGPVWSVYYCIPDIVLYLYAATVNIITVPLSNINVISRAIPRPQQVLAHETNINVGG